MCFVSRQPLWRQRIKLEDIYYKYLTDELILIGEVPVWKECWLSNTLRTATCESCLQTIVWELAEGAEKQTCEAVSEVCGGL